MSSIPESSLHKIIYEDVLCIAKTGTSCEGHVQIFAKEKYKEIPSDVYSHLFFVANFCAASAFEQMGLSGTNIIVNNEFDVFCIDVIPRKEDDGINFAWDIKKMVNPKELEEICSKIKDDHFSLQQERKKKKENLVKEQKIIDDGKGDGVKSFDKSSNPLLKKELIEKIPMSPKELEEDKPKITANKNKETDYRIAELRRIP